MNREYSPEQFSDTYPENFGLDIRLETMGPHMGRAALAATGAEVLLTAFGAKPEIQSLSPEERSMRQAYGKFHSSKAMDFVSMHPVPEIDFSDVAAYQTGEVYDFAEASTLEPAIAA